MRSLSLLALVLGATACTKPTSGSYLITFGDVGGDCEPVEDTGGDTGGGEIEPESVAIVVADDGKSMTFGEPQPSTPGYTNECTLAGLAFDCPLYVSSDEMDGTVVSTNISVSGKWTSSAKIEGTYVSGSSCEGDGCADYESFGFQFCTAEAAFTGELVEE